jgi:endonuclease/exonuclease/phosphatase family metal-dependent hydrolase
MRFWNRRNRWLLLVLLVLIAAVAIVFTSIPPVSTGSAQGTAFIGPAATQPTGTELGIGTFNIDGGQGLDGVTDLARTARCMQKLDFIGMEEVHGFYVGDPPNQEVILSSLLHLPGLWVPTEKRFGHETFGNAAFSDLPIESWQRIELPSEPHRAKRNYLLTKAIWHGKPLYVITTHTDWKSGGERQFEIVRDAFLKLPTPAILMGDLNTPRTNPLIGNLLKTPGVEEAISQILDPIPGRVDWIFLRGLKTVNAGMVDIKASDHPAYWAAVR